MNPKVFVSYSRSDRQLVTPLVQLLRLRGDLVFFDLDSISPGQLWRDELEAAIASASWFVLFWCEHSSQSREVEREFRAALSLGKKIVPLILDDTRIPDRVADFQGIDFRSIPGFHPKTCEQHGSDPLAPFIPSPPVPRSGAGPAADASRPAAAPAPRIPDDFVPFADVFAPAPPASPQPKAGAPAPPDLQTGIDSLFGLGPASSAGRPSEASLQAAAEALVSFLQTHPA